MDTRLTDADLLTNLFRVLDTVLESGRAVEIERQGRLLRIEAIEPDDPLARLKPHPEAVRSDLDSLVDIDWSAEWNPSL